MSSRKRRAPGASPVGQQNTYQGTASVATDQFMNWNDPSMSAGNMSGFDPALYEGVDFGSNMGQPSTHNRVVSLDGLGGSPDMNSNQLVRRNPNHQLAARGQTPWDPYNQNQSGTWESGGTDDDEELARKAEIAKKDAQAKRKQIPPFVQKLSRQVYCSAVWAVRQTTY